MLESIEPQISPVYHFTPQIRKNPRYEHVQRLSHRISFIKERLKKHKHETFQEMAQLKQMNQTRQFFEDKVTSELQKCHQLKETQLKNQQNEPENNLRKDKQNQTDNFGQNLYNLDSLNSNPNSNSQIFANQSYPTSLYQIPAPADLPKTKPLNLTKPLYKIPTDKSPKNTPSKSNYQHLYFKETFLTSIILLLVCLLLWRFLLLF